MKFVRCPHCRRIKFLDKKNNPLWIKLYPNEEVVLEIISSSNYLILLVNRLEEIPECCDECDLVEKN